jgi:hypothetical protein
VPELKLLAERRLSAGAADLIQFDANSIRQIARAGQAGEPDFWVADPDRYERNGRIFRDSESARLLAYSSSRQILFATDGCNSCARHVRTKLQELGAEELRTFADENDLPLELLTYLASLL